MLEPRGIHVGIEAGSPRWDQVSVEAPEEKASVQATTQANQRMYPNGESDSACARHDVAYILFKRGSNSESLKSSISYPE